MTSIEARNTSKINKVIEEVSTKEKGDTKTRYYAFTIAPGPAALKSDESLVQECMIEGVTGAVYFLECFKNIKGQHVHGLARTETCHFKKAIKDLEASLNRQYPEISFKLRECWNVKIWAQYIQKDGGVQFSYPHGRKFKWWAPFRENVPSFNDTRIAQEKIKTEVANDEIIYTKIASWFEDNGIYIELDSMMCYTKHPKDNIFVEFTTQKSARVSEHVTAHRLISKLLGNLRLVGIREKDSYATEMIKNLDPITLPDQTKDVITNSLDKFCIRLQHSCIMFDDFAIEAPFPDLITGNELQQVKTSKIQRGISLTNRQLEAKEYNTKENPIYEILDHNGELAIETLSQIYRSLGHRNGSKQAILLVGVSNGRKSTLLEYIKSLYPRKAIASFSGAKEGNLEMAPHVNATIFVLDECDKFLAGGAITKLIIEGSDMDVSMKSSNDAKQTKNESTPWLSTNVKKDADKWLNEPEMTNRLFFIVFRKPFTKNGKDKKEVIQFFKDEQGKIMNWLFEADRIFQLKDETVWENVKMYSDTQEEKKIELLKMHNDLHGCMGNTVNNKGDVVAKNQKSKQTEDYDSDEEEVYIPDDYQ